MARGNANFSDSQVNGDPLTPALANALASLIGSGDDSLLQDLIGMEQAVTAQKSWMQIRNPAKTDSDTDRPHVEGSAGLAVTVNPIRCMRGALSTDVGGRNVMSATSDASTSVSLPTAPTAGNWGLLLLYASIAWVDDANHSKGSQISFAFAAPTYVAFASAPNIGALPADSGTAWRIPLALVKTYAGQATVAQDEITPAIGATASTSFRRQRLFATLLGIDVRRASCENFLPGNLISGGSSVFSTAPNRLTYQLTPAVMVKEDEQMVVRRIVIPSEGAKGTAGVDTTFNVDDTRDWRKGTFIAFWTGAVTQAATQYLGEESASTGTAAQRAWPADIVGGTRSPMWITHGQTFEVWNGGATLQAGRITSAAGLAGPTTGTSYLASPDFLALTADVSTGVLKLTRNIAGAGVGGPLHILLIGFFTNHR
jgi:hypothetical protein